MKLLAIERQRRGWSKAELARRAGLHPSQIGQFEAGRLLPYEGQLAKIARAFGWPLADAGQLIAEANPDEYPRPRECSRWVGIPCMRRSETVQFAPFGSVVAYSSPGPPC